MHLLQSSFETAKQFFKLILFDLAMQKLIFSNILRSVLIYAK